MWGLWRSQLPQLSQIGDLFAIYRVLYLNFVWFSFLWEIKVSGQKWTFVLLSILVEYFIQLHGCCCLFKKRCLVLGLQLLFVKLISKWVLMPIVRRCNHGCFFWHYGQSFFQLLLVQAELLAFVSSLDWWDLEALWIDQCFIVSNWVNVMHWWFWNSLRLCIWLLCIEQVENLTHSVQ